MKIESFYIILLLITACSSPSIEVTNDEQGGDNATPEINEFILQQYPDLISNLVLVYADEHTAQLSSFESLLDSLWTNRSFFSRWVTQEITSIPHSQFNSAKHQQADVIIGLVPTKTTVPSIEVQAPESLMEHTLSFLDTLNLEPDDVVIMGRRGIQDTYILATNNSDDLKRFLPYMQVEGYHVFRGSKRIITGAWLREESGWESDPGSHRALHDEITESREATYFRYHNHLDALPEANFNRFIERSEAKFERIAGFLDIEPNSITPPDYFLYDRFEDKGLFFGAFFSSYRWLVPDVKHVDVTTREVHRAVGEEIDRFNWHQDVDPLLFEALGPASYTFLQTGLSMYLSDSWHDQGYAYWAARLYYAEQIPPLQELLDDDREAFVSPFMQQALAGSLVNFMLEEWGKEKFLNQYATWSPGEEELNTLEQDWLAALKGQYERVQLEAESHRSRFPEVTAFQKGFTYAPSPGRNGYLTKSSDASLARLNNLGVDAVALIPYGFTQIDQPTVIIPEQRMNGENDAAMVHAILDAKRLGQMVMLKPQLLTRGGWVGEVAMQSDADWDAFYHYYERWMSHYAMMAELYEVDLLCIGTELVKATEDEERWIHLANKIRKLYSGKLVYASNWGEEFERITFWQHLDYIGLDNYYPLSKADTVSDDALIEAANRIAQQVEGVSQTYNRPVIFTEMGFAATTTPWKQPHETSGERDLEGLAQSRGYHAWFSAFYGKPWVAGMYWWKWFSYDPEENRSIDFTPQRKRTEQVIKEWYSKEW